MTKLIERSFNGLKVVLTGGNDGAAGGQGPLLVLLHGFGAPGRDLVPLSQMIAGPPGLRFAFPAAPLSLELGGGDFGFSDSRAWWQIDMALLERRLRSAAHGDYSQLIEDKPAGLEEAHQQLVGTLDELERALEVPAGRMFLGGFSQGAMLSLDVALRSDRKLAGLALMSGTLLNASEWQKGMPRRAGLPVMQSHGRQDPLLPFGLAEKLRDLLQSAGLGVEFVPFSGGHEIPPAVLRKLSELVSRAAT